MGKNWMQKLTLALNVVLVLLLLWQGARLEELQKSMTDRDNEMLHRFQDLQNQVADVRDNLEEQATAIESWTLEPTGVDAGSQTLTADVVVQLKQWSPDSVVDLTIICGGETERAALSVDETGVCRGEIAVPTARGEIRLETAVTSGGVTVREDLGGWEGIYMLLPLQLSGSSVSGPTYQEGALSSNFDLVLTNESGTAVVDPVFRIYRNGNLEQEVEAEPSQTMSTTRDDVRSYAPALPDQTMRLQCDPGDQIEIRFACTDGYGLGYDFPYLSWAILEDGSVADQEITDWMMPLLTWPE